MSSVTIYLYSFKLVLLLSHSIKSSLKLLEYKKWFRSFAGEWVNAACTSFHSGVKKSTEETCEVRNYIATYCFSECVKLVIISDKAVSGPMDMFCTASPCAL